MVIDYSVIDLGVFSLKDPLRGGGGRTVLRACNEKFEIQKICCGWNFYFLKNVFVCLFVQMVWFNTEIGLFSFYLVHYKFYSKAHMIKFQFNLTIQNIVFVMIVIHRDLPLKLSVMNYLKIFYVHYI